jgi:hypothetical protein
MGRIRSERLASEFGIKMSTLANLDTITLWCDCWYPTLVPDFRVDE